MRRMVLISPFLARQHLGKEHRLSRQNPKAALPLLVAVFTTVNVDLTVVAAGMSVDEAIVVVVVGSLEGMVADTSHSDKTALLRRHNLYPRARQFPHLSPHLSRLVNGQFHHLEPPHLLSHFLIPWPRGRSRRHLLATIPISLGLNQASSTRTDKQWRNLRLLDLPLQHLSIQQHQLPPGKTKDGNQIRALGADPHNHRKRRNHRSHLRGRSMHSMPSISNHNSSSLRRRRKSSLNHINNTNSNIGVSKATVRIGSIPPQ